MQIDTVIADLDGIDVGALLGFEVGDRVQATERLQFSSHVGCDLARIETVAALTGDGLERLGEGRHLEYLAHARCTAILQQVHCSGFVGLELGDRAGPIVGDARGDDEALLGKLDRRCQQLVEAHGAVVFEQPRPAVDGARYGYRMRTLRFDLLDALAGVPLRRRSFRRHARRIECDQLLPRLRDDGETIATDAGHRRLEHGQHRRSRDRSVYCIAALLQNLDSRQARQRMRRRNHRVLGMHGGSARKMEGAHLSGSVRLSLNWSSGEHNATRSAMLSRHWAKLPALRLLNPCG